MSQIETFRYDDEIVRKFLLEATAMAGSSVTVVLNSLRQKRQFPA